jgi:hypothetical protein
MKKLILPTIFCICFVFSGNFLFGQSKDYIYQNTTNKPSLQYSEPIDELIADSVYTEEELFKKGFNKKDDWRSGRIVGGSDADIEDYPWHVALLNSMGNQICAGSILSETWILTAAHCGIPSKIRAGVTNRTDITGQDRIVIQRISHPLYTPYQNDVALLQLGSPLDFSDPKVQPIEIATQAHADEGFTDAGVMSVITGWGKTLEGGSTTDILQVAELPIVSNQDAVNFGGYNPGQITIDMLCAGYMGIGGIDACHGDSGGPLVVPDPGSDLGFVLAGVTSWGYGCARPEYPGVWARVSYFESWINSHTGLIWDPPSVLPNLSDFNAEASTCNQIQINWNKNILNNDVLLALSDDGFFGSPVNGISYSIGDTIPDGGTVLYTGSNTAFLHTDLEPGTVYFYKAWAVNNQLEYSIGRFARDTTDCLEFILPFTETFEDDSGSRNCWSQTWESSNQSWIFASGSNGGSVSMALAGQKNARFTGSNGGPHITKLVSPILNLTLYENVELSFWYAQQAWAGDQNQMKLYYRTAESDPWTQIGNAYSASISSWTHVQNIILPNPSPTYQIAFEGMDNWGYANVIDEVEIAGTYIGPPEVLSLQNLLLEDGNEQCYAATGQVYVAGNGSAFVVEDGGIAVITAGQSIHFYEGTLIESGGILHAYIDTDGVFCTLQPDLLTISNEVSNEELISERVSTGHPKNFTSGFRLYPNPTTGQITLDIHPNDGVSTILIEIFNILGEKVLVFNLPAQKNHILDMSAQQPGLYIVRILNGKVLITETIVIQ